MLESGENYLETLYMLHRKTGRVRSIDVASALGYSKPSVSRAMSILRREGFVDMAPDGTLRLTEAGQARAAAIYERHRYITAFLVETLGIDAAQASQDACRIEHIISENTYQQMKKRVAHPDVGR
nr:metal-dependent transcriptional regulator [Maliibacterium massiliense]